MAPKKGLFLPHWFSFHFKVTEKASLKIEECRYLVLKPNRYKGKQLLLKECAISNRPQLFPNHLPNDFS